MNDIFELNLKALESSPNATHLLERLKDSIEKFRANPDGSPEDKILKIVDGSLGTKNLVYVRQNPPFQSMYYNPDGISEAHNVIRGVDMKYPQIVFIFGMGLGYMLEAFMSIKTRETWGIFVIEKDPDLFVRAMAANDLREYFKNESIIWSIGDEIEALKAKLVAFFEMYSTVNRSIKILASPSALRTENEYYGDAAKAIIPSRDQATIWAGNSVEDNFVGFRNTCDNLDFLSQNPGIYSLKDKFKGKICFSVAAGPSLNEAWDILKTYQGRIPIIACDTLVKPMNDRGIYPDFFTALERDPIVADFFRGQPINERTTLLAPSLLLPESWKCFEGRKLSYCATPPYSVNLDLLHLGAVSPGSSAGNLNIAMASWMGFETVIMIGHNLAFAHGTFESHVKGTIDKNREAHRSEEEMRKMATGGKVPTQDGESEVYTIMEYTLFKRQIEGAIASAPQMTFINTAAKGQKIQGAKYMPLAKAVEQYYKEDFDLYPELLKALESHTQEMADRRIHRSFKRLEKTIEAIESFEKKSTEMHEKLVTWRQEIEQAEAGGEKFSLVQLNKRLDEVLSLKVAGVNEDAAFSAGFIGVISPVHIVFERSINDLLGKHTNDYDLKKDFLLQHEKYFTIWNKWLPRIKEVYLKTIDRIRGVLPEQPESLEELSPGALRTLESVTPEHLISK